MEPNIIRRTNAGVQAISLNTELLSRRILFLNSEINTQTAELFIQQLMALAASTEPVTVFIGSCGGEIQAGLSIIDVMKACPFTIRTVSLGMAASMGAVLLSAGTKGQRMITPHSRVMVHEPLIVGGIGGSCSTIEAISQNLNRTRDMMNGLLSEFTGKPLDEVAAATSYDNFMNADEALEFGMVDRIIEREELGRLMTGINLD